MKFFAAIFLAVFAGCSYDPVHQPVRPLYRNEQNIVPPPGPDVPLDKLGPCNCEICVFPA